MVVSGMTDLKTTIASTTSTTTTKHKARTCLIASIHPTLRCLYELFSRIREAQYDERVAEIAKNVIEIVLWTVRLGDHGEFQNLMDVIENDANRLQAVIKDASLQLQVGNLLSKHAAARKNIVQLNRKPRKHLRVWNVTEYDPPGQLSEKGPRHYNDHERIQDIGIVPTMDEILCGRGPFLPGSSPQAPHFYPLGPGRWIDTQFRLLREDMVGPLRSGVCSFVYALNAGEVKISPFGKFLPIAPKAGDGWIGDDTANMIVYPNAQVESFDVDPRNGCVFVVRFQPPRYGERFNGKKNRESFWSQNKRLMNGALVCLVLDGNKENGQRQPSDSSDALESESHLITWAIVVNRDAKMLSEDETSAKLSLKLVRSSSLKFFFHELSEKRAKRVFYLVETPGILFESYRPILESLKSIIPAAMPFAKYIAPTEEELRLHKTIAGAGNIQNIAKPIYARLATFSWDFSPILKSSVTYNITFGAEDTTRAVDLLKRYSTLDAGQAEALVDCLNRELALVEGPPGTGKTYLGVMLVRLLLGQRTPIKPILVICLTNHALDQFLEHILDDSPDTKVVRMGSRSKSERIYELSLENVSDCKLRTEQEELEEEIKKLRGQLKRTVLSWDQVRAHLYSTNYNQYLSFSSRDDDGKVGNEEEDDSEGEWQTVSRKGKNADVVERWLKDGMNTGGETSGGIATDNAFDSLSGGSKKEDKTTARTFLQRLTATSRWRRRSLSNIVETQDVWAMSIPERRMLHDHWKSLISDHLVEEITTLADKLNRLNTEKNTIYDETRRQHISAMDVIGVTTTGAAKFQNMIRSVSAPVILCEEAGEVLEAHILSSLSDNTKHLVLIGDPHQLRPSIASYCLSKDSNIGKSFMLDQSLMERLGVANDSAFPMSKLGIQRRMRPDIADLIRKTLYPHLVDEANTKAYPDVGGMHKNLFFLNHGRPQDGSEDPLAMKSHANTFEALMVVGLVKHLLRNGKIMPVFGVSLRTIKVFTSIHSALTKPTRLPKIHPQKGYRPGEIAVLTPYLGQFLKLKRLLSQECTVQIDDRDVAEIAKILDEGEIQIDQADIEGLALPCTGTDGKDGSSSSTTAVKMLSAMRVQLNDQVTLRTVDNFQGEESKIVIVSLVRSERGKGKKASQADTLDDDDADEAFPGRTKRTGSIGFLKSYNRTNVLLSRAQHGMYLLGNGDLLSSKSDMWRKMGVALCRVENDWPNVDMFAHIDAMLMTRLMSRKCAQNPVRDSTNRADTPVRSDAGRTVGDAKSKLDPSSSPSAATHIPTPNVGKRQRFSPNLPNRPHQPLRHPQQWATLAKYRSCLASNAK
ncbi:hypothetical protein HK102_009383 [Quaeritorhiza haematococci]|nr:hypothetical protein HK102_009383 [Quaeritorhiza haematococci]